MVKHFVCQTFSDVTKAKVSKMLHNFENDGSTHSFLFEDHIIFLLAPKRVTFSDVCSITF